MIISHIKIDNGEWKIQSNEDHCNSVAKKTEMFASQFGMGDWGYIIGLLHDKGKESIAFQNYIKYNSGFDKSIYPTLPHTHAWVGGFLFL